MTTTGDLVARLNDYRRTLPADFTVTEAAARFVKVMADEHPDELAAWQEAQTVTFVADSLRHLLRSRRAQAVARHGARRFQAAAEDEATFAQAYAVNGEHLWRRVSDMTGADHRWVAEQYEARGRRQLTLAAFHRAVAKKVGARRTEEVMSEDEYGQLLAEFLG